MCGTHFASLLIRAWPRSTHQGVAHARPDDGPKYCVEDGGGGADETSAARARREGVVLECVLAHLGSRECERARAASVARAWRAARDEAPAAAGVRLRAARDEGDPRALAEALAEAACWRKVNFTDGADEAAASGITRVAVEHALHRAAAAGGLTELAQTAGLRRTAHFALATGEDQPHHAKINLCVHQSGPGVIPHLSALRSWDEGGVYRMNTVAFISSIWALGYYVDSGFCT